MSPCCKHAQSHGSYIPQFTITHLTLITSQIFSLRPYSAGIQALSQTQVHRESKQDWVHFRTETTGNQHSRGLCVFFTPLSAPQRSIWLIPEVSRREIGDPTWSSVALTFSTMYPSLCAMVPDGDQFSSWLPSLLEIWPSLAQQWNLGSPCSLWDPWVCHGDAHGCELIPITLIRQTSCCYQPTLSLCVYTHVRHIWVLPHMYRCVWSSEVDAGCFPWLLPTLFDEVGSVADPTSHWFPGLA